MRTFNLSFGLLTLITMLNSSIATAQHTSKGSFVIGSRIGFATANSSVEVQGEGTNFSGDGGQAFQVNISPGIGYFFVDNFAVGIGMDYISNGNRAQVDFEDPSSEVKETSSTNLLFGPFLRLFLPIADDQAFFIGGSLGFGRSDGQFDNGTDIQSINNEILTMGIGPGFTIFAKNGVALEMLAKYNYARARSNTDIQGIERTSNTRTHAFDFSVGFQYYFGGTSRKVANQQPRELRDIMNGGK